MGSERGTPGSVSISLPAFAPPAVSGLVTSWRQTEVPLEPPVGRYLGALQEAGRFEASLQLREGGNVARVACFHAADTAGSAAVFAHLFTDPAFQQYQAAPVHAYLGREVVVLGHDAVVMVDGAALPETVSYIMTWRPGSRTERFVQGQSLTLRQKLPLIPSPVLDEVVIGFTASWNNYAHWMQESMPKLMAFLMLRARRPGLRVALPELTPGSFQAQCVAMLGISTAELVTVAVGEAVSFAHGWVITNTDIWAIHPILRDISALLVARCPPPERNDRRLYIRREQTLRQVANFDELIPTLEAAGFEVIAFEGMSLAEQIVTMQSATMVVAEHGAGLANIQFCRPGTAVLELFNEACVQPAFWSEASCFGLRFGFLIGRSLPDAQGHHDWNSSYDIEPADLRLALERMGAD